jgi:hypothetical protein
VAQLSTLGVMTTPLTDSWDADLQEKRWRSSLEKGRQAVDQLGPKLVTSSPGFYVLCLAEVDAVGAFHSPECFASRSTFIAELERLIAEPTEPSRPVPSIQAYIESQRWFLQMEIKTMTPNKSPEPTAVGACSSASRFTVFRRRWLSFFR